MKYISTRSGETVSSAAALLRGLAADGGLYIPENIPAPFLRYEDIAEKSYEETAVNVLRRFFTDIPEDELTEIVGRAYADTFNTREVVPVRPVNQAFSVAELFHGRTCAFKDLALSLFPHLLLWAKKHEKETKKILILTATSGDTGKAALEGFRDVPGTGILVFYPAFGVSPLQQEQMQKQTGGNVRVTGIEGNFDDAQGCLKKIFSNPAARAAAAEKGVLFSSANSINIGRLFPQVVYYVWIWMQLIRNGSIGREETFDVAVPTGNFGNILAAWYARRIGTPIRKLICASNKNRVLADFLKTGLYNRKREFYETDSPSMDILVSSNFERFLYYITNGEKDVKAAMSSLDSKGEYRISEKQLKAANEEIIGGWADDAESRAAIAEMYENYEYLIDPHTAVAYSVYEGLRKKGGLPRRQHTVITATAHPYKFPFVMAQSLGIGEETGAYDMLRAIEKKTGVPIPEPLSVLEKRPLRFTEVIPKDGMADEIGRYVAEIGDI